MVELFDVVKRIKFGSEKTPALSRADTQKRFTQWLFPQYYLLVTSYFPYHAKLQASLFFIDHIPLLVVVFYVQLLEQLGNQHSVTITCF